jgi:ribosomal protein S3AE
MAQQQTQSKTKKVTKKSFFEVSAPMTATKIQLYAASQEELAGKTVKLDLTKSLRGKNLELKLRIKLEDGNLVCEPESAQLTSSYLKKVIRKGTDYAEDSFEAECRDCIVRIKPLVATRRRVSRTVLKLLRQNAKEFIEAYLKTRTGKEILSEIITNKLQKQLALKLKKIYPLALCEIRMFSIEKMKDSSKEEN